MLKFLLLIFFLMFNVSNYKKNIDQLIKCLIEINHHMFIP